MQDTILQGIAKSLNSHAAELNFLHKLNDQEGEMLARLIAALEVHGAAERYHETHWEDD
ncbi:conserved protein of unknown function [Acidithiobacillus ferrivorans]|jgi:hypothetical protein|uniref:Uncharacterized protein n=2 Tax=Acidithiobacillus ferrivorans TaxID=160808 RepID=A0A060UME9_9PROT|nr:hypothetical protein [Acidithiobacillus ferrivorans]AEM46771.1 hypothetical protein Acife_0565 [Acidithiobacillus ferrivorans SS3]MBU2766870.1 hypothetical protein [Acidithiobacillus ferrivorans]MBU2850815.1 hypothetical protein [Acidithiobacillus ferrivorans]QQD72330.1 hypothetical protein H2515_13145 [Acidithiobacillus ferrivorans]CDQ09640.1 conserved hypothetical protein [Acidithiobacillus ferrivorans]